MNTIPNATKLGALARYVTKRDDIANMHIALFRIDLKAFLDLGETLTGATYAKTGTAMVEPIEWDMTPIDDSEMHDPFTPSQWDTIYAALLDRRPLNEVILLDIIKIGEKIPMFIGLIPLRPIPLSPKELVWAQDVAKRWTEHLANGGKHNEPDTR